MNIKPLGIEIIEFKPNLDALNSINVLYTANIDRRLNYELIAFINGIFSFKIRVTIKILIADTEIMLLSYIGERKFNIQDDFDGSLNDRIVNDKIAIYEILKKELIDAEFYIIYNEKRLKYEPRTSKKITVWVQELIDFLKENGFYE